MSYLQAIVIGLLQGVTELFPISSLGHSVLVPAWLGWDNIANSQNADESFFLAFLVGLHVATAVALLIYFRREWARIIGGLFTSVRHRRIETPDERLGWLLILGTIPVGVVGLLFEHDLRTVFAIPAAAAAFLTVNGIILLAGEQVRRRAEKRHALAGGGERQLSSLTMTDGALVGSSQILALFAGISRAGVTMVAGLLRGLDHEDAARFSFLLATPVILAAGVYKLHDLTGPLGEGYRGQILVGSIAAGVASYLSVRFLVRYFTSRNLNPFGVYCLVVGIVSLIRFH
jgi:undecaprenyl-diphosphatase